MNFRFLALAAALIGISSTASDAAPISLPIPDPASQRGVIVVATETTAGALSTFAKQAPAVIIAVAPNVASAQSLSVGLRAAGSYGQVTVLALQEADRIPLATDTAAVVIGGSPGVGDGELSRIARPFGTIYRKAGDGWNSEVKPRPEGADDWAHYNGDARNSQHNADTLVGAPVGLQWIAGPTNQQKFMLIGGPVVLSTDRPRGGHVNDRSAMARDAFSGLPLWTLPGNSPATRWSAVFDGDHLFYHGTTKGRIDPHSRILNAATGETLATLTDGFDFTVTPEEQKADRRALSNMLARAKELQFRVAEGVLVQCIREEVIALDAKSGKRLWSRKASPDPQPLKENGQPKDRHTYYGFASPTVGGGTLFLVEGPYQRYSSYTNWPMSRPEHIHALDLRTGKERWTLTWDTNKFRKPHAIYSMQYEEVDGAALLAAAVTGYHPEVKKDAARPRPSGLILDAKIGAVKYYGREEGAWPGTTGHGHSHVRMHLRGREVWNVVIGGPVATWNIDRPGDFVDLPKYWRDKGVGMRPVSCTVWRSTPNFWFGGLGMYPLARGGSAEQVHFNRSGRSDCDIGAFPANGILFSPPNTCQCQPYLPGAKAYHSRPPGEPVSDDARLLSGSAKPATVKASDADWPQWGQGPARRFWIKAETPTALRQLWQAKLAPASAPDLIAGQWQRDAVLHGPATASSVAGGVLVTARPQSHEIVARDAATGAEKWRAAVNGRVDLAPTIHSGLVIAGTRNGYVYALNRDSGELVWRFTAAPREERIIVNGQPESPWPVFGAVPVDEKGVLAIAGRHTSNDGGLWWWQLDPATGKITAKGRIHDGAGAKKAANWVDKLEIDERPIQNTVAVLSDNTFQLVGQPLRRTEAGLGDSRASADGNASEPCFIPWEDFDKGQFDELVIRSGRNAIIGERQQTVGGWKKARYANTLARIFAIDPDGKEFVSVGGGLFTAGGRGGGGDSKVHRMRLRDEGPTEERRFKVYAKTVWENDDKMLHSRSDPAIGAVAVSDSAIYLGLSIVGSESNKIFRDGRAEMPHRLRVLDLKSGELIKDYPLPAQTLQGGVAIAGGKIFVTTEDGSITAFGAE